MQRRGVDNGREEAGKTATALLSAGGTEKVSGWMSGGCSSCIVEWHHAVVSGAEGRLTYRGSEVF